MNDNIIKIKTESNNTIFLTKSKNLIKPKNLYKSRSIKAIKKSNLLTFNIRKTLTF